MLRRELAHYGSCFADAVRKALFEQLTSTRTTRMGVGLTILKSMIEAHYGRISRETGRVGAGSNFDFTLSFAAAESDE
jgi:signal transduction histidine kinase